MYLTVHGCSRPHNPHNPIHRAFENLFEDAAAARVDAGNGWSPRVDIRDEGERFLIEADIPGIDPKDIEVSMDKNVLSLRGERKLERSRDNGKFSRIERLHGVFHRRFALPDSVDAEGIKARGKHGVLEISIPKKPETTPRRINIDAGE